MNVIYFFGAAFIVVASQGDFAPQRSHAPTMAPCVEDSFMIAGNCHRECLQILSASNVCVRCNTTCNTTRERLCPNIYQCTLGCPLSRDSESGCPVCECENSDNRPDGAELNPCIVNATDFSRLHLCNPSCVSRREDGCFMCNSACNSTNGNRYTSYDQCGVQGRTCPSGRICLLQGILNKCIRMPTVGNVCERKHLAWDRINTSNIRENGHSPEEQKLDENDFDAFSHIEGALDRLRIFALQISSELKIPCAGGSLCSDEGQCIEIPGSCAAARRNSTLIKCDDKGRKYQPLQCHHNKRHGTHTCHCVHPKNGRIVPGSTKRGIRRRRDIPDCKSKVYKFCKHDQDGHHFNIHHGQNFIEHKACKRCLCNNGNATSCQRDPQLHCRFLHHGARPQACTYVHRHRNHTIHHGQKMKIGKCNMCGCHNGRLICTDIEGCNNDGEHQDERDEHKRQCEQCQDAPMRLVCGRDGRTYRSRCVAMNCSGWGENDILDGPCSNQPICSLYPCQPGFACIPLGGRSCLRHGGCKANERRICVNRTKLRCRVTNSFRHGIVSDDDDAVCGSDRRHYRSFCHMIQQAPPNTTVAHAGRCDKDECNSGLVCGTDGVTYNSACHLRTQSANAQLDYRGECMGIGNRKLKDICHHVRDREKRCEHNWRTCQHRVMSHDGCCPICGGITILAIDIDALNEYSRATNTDTDVDTFMVRMTRDDEILVHVQKRCRIEVTHVRNSTQTNIEIKMIAKNSRTDSHFCHNGSISFAAKINDGTGATNITKGSTTVSTGLPIETSFARAAVAAPLIADVGGNGTPGLMAASFYTFLALLGATIVATF